MDRRRFFLVAHGKSVETFELFDLEVFIGFEISCA